MYGTRDRIFFVSGSAGFHCYGEQWHESLPMMRMAADDLTYDSRSVYRTVCVIFRWPKPRLPCDQWLHQGIPRRRVSRYERSAIRSRYATHFPRGYLGVPRDSTLAMVLQRPARAE